LTNRFVKRQTGNDPTQVRFRELLARVANCEATETDWQWLQTRCSTSLTCEENQLFDDCKHVVANNDTRKIVNREKLSKLSPVIRIDDCDDDAFNVEEETYDGDRYGVTNDSQLFAVGSDVMMTINLWTEAGLVNGACGTVVGILKPDDARKARILMVDFPRYRGPVLDTRFPTVVPVTQVSSRQLKGIPLTLSWAITIHKSQGMTLDRVTVDLGDSEYSSGLTFVALSRAKSFLGLRVRPFDLRRYTRITAGKYVLARRSEYSRLRLLAAATY
jgi:ATP-dependent exoDNAse (exonuclease V) alpha subunit